jgi:uncharacterized membrane protein
MSAASRPPVELPPMPLGRLMETVDELLVHAPVGLIHEIASDVEHWPAHLAHYRYVRFRERASDGGGLVEMSAYRLFGPLGWPTWWLSLMSVDAHRPAIRFHHVGGVTRGMDVEWQFEEMDANTTQVRIVHVWDGPSWPLIGPFAATNVIGPVFVHGIAQRTLAGLAKAAEREAAVLPYDSGEPSRPDSSGPSAGRALPASRTP